MDAVTSGVMRCGRGVILDVVGGDDERLAPRQHTSSKTQSRSRRHKFMPLSFPTPCSRSTRVGCDIIKPAEQRMRREVAQVFLRELAQGADHRRGRAQRTRGQRPSAWYSLPRREKKVSHRRKPDVSSRRGIAIEKQKPPCRQATPGRKSERRGERTRCAPATPAAAKPLNCSAAETASMRGHVHEPVVDRSRAQRHSLKFLGRQLRDERIEQHDPPRTPENP